MLKTASLFFVGLTLAAVPASAQTAQSQTPTPAAITEPPNYVLPESLDAMTKSVDTVALSRCERVEMIRDSYGSIVAECHAKITEILKFGAAPMAVGDVVSVRIPGGREIEGKLVPAADISGLHGRATVLFLHWSEPEKVFYLAGGLNGAYDVSAGAVEPLGTAPAAKAQRGKPVTQFIATLKGTAR